MGCFGGPVGSSFQKEGSIFGLFKPKVGWPGGKPCKKTSEKGGQGRGTDEVPLKRTQVLNDSNVDMPATGCRWVYNASRKNIIITLYIYTLYRQMKNGNNCNQLPFLLDFEFPYFFQLVTTPLPSTTQGISRFEDDETPKTYFVFGNSASHHVGQSRIMTSGKLNS